jgi:hypothetical protein
MGGCKLLNFHPHHSERKNEVDEKMGIVTLISEGEDSIN